MGQGISCPDMSRQVKSKMLDYSKGGVYVTIKGKPAQGGLGWGLQESDRLQRGVFRRHPAKTMATISKMVAQFYSARKLEMAAMVIYFLKLAEQEF